MSLISVATVTMMIKKCELLDLYGGFCRSAASKWAGWAESEDLYHAAVLGLYEAYEAADYELLEAAAGDDFELLRAVFLSFASFHISNAVRAQAAQSGIAYSINPREAFNEQLPERVDLDEAAEVANDDGEGSDADIVDTLMSLIGDFDKDDSRAVTIFWGAYIHGAPDRAIAELLGCNRETVRAKRQEMLVKLRKAYANL